MTDKRLLTVKELEEFLNVPKSWIYDRTYRGEIPHFKLGKLLRFDLEKIKEWLKANEKGSDLKTPHQMR